MSDREGGPSGEDDVGLPKATVFKLIQEMLPPDITCAKDAREIIVECCVEWVKLLATQSNAICDASSKKTISPEHVTAALKELGFEDMIPEVDASNTEFKKHLKDRTRAQPDTGGLSQEELLALQEKLFASSQARFEAGQ